MKKTLLIISVFVGCLALTGCGTETLTCSQTGKYGGTTTTQEIETTFENDKVKAVETTISLKYPDSYEDNMNKIKKNMEGMLKSNEKKGITVNVSTDKTTLKYSLKTEIDKISDEDKASFGFDAKKNQSKADVQKSLEKQGYTCK